MTDAPTIDDHTERLARLRERRGRSAPTDRLALTAPTTTEPGHLDGGRERRTAGGAAAPDTTADAHTATGDSPASASRRRRSPAVNAKIVTVGASVTAMFGMIAGYGIADGLSAEHPEPAPQPVGAAAAPSAELPTAVTGQPQVIVVVVDGATGRTLSTTSGDDALDAALDAAGSLTPTAPAGEAAATIVAPAPVAAPVAVDLAVPVPPPPPATRPGAPAPAAEPQATSSGS